MYRSRKTTKAYKPERSKKEYEARQIACPFCELDDRRVHVDGKHVMVVDNLFPYEFWDQHNVIEHLLLLPKRHVLNLAELTDAEKVEYMQTMADYEQAGFSIYWRSQDNKARTVPHQHTHLIKVADEDLHFLLYAAKPYLFWKG